MRVGRWMWTGTLDIINGTVNGKVKKETLLLILLSLQCSDVYRDSTLAESRNGVATRSTLKRNVTHEDCATSCYIGMLESVHKSVVKYNSLTTEYKISEIAGNGKANPFVSSDVIDNMSTSDDVVHLNLVCVIWIYYNWIVIGTNRVKLYVLVEVNICNMI